MIIMPKKDMILEAILLFFLENKDNRNYVTVNSIESSLHISKSTISRILTFFVKRDYITVKKVNEDYKKRKVNGYQLSENGYRYIIDIKEKVVNRKIFVIDWMGNIINTNIKKLLYMLPEDQKLYRIIENIEYDIYDMRRIFDPILMDTLHSETYVNNRWFTGRKTELTSIHEYIMDKAGYLLFINGITGIGKTATVEQYLVSYNQGFIWINGYEAASIKSIILHFIFKIDPSLYSSYMHYSNRTGFNMMMEDALYLTKIISKYNGIIVIDDFHILQPDIKNFIKYVIKDTRYINRNLRWIIISREYDSFFKKSTYSKFIEISPLSYGSVKELVKKISNKNIDVMNAYTTTYGVPQLIFNYVYNDRIENSLLEHLDTLTDNEKELLFFLSILTYPIDSEWLEKVFGKQVLDTLFKRSYIKTLAGDKIVIIEIIKAFIDKNLDIKNKIELHKKAMRYYQFKTSLNDKIEFMKHAFNADEIDSVLEHILYWGNTIIMSGYAKELKKIIQDIINLNKVEILSILYYFMGEIEMVDGDYSRSKKDYFLALEYWKYLKTKDLDKNNIIFSIIKIYQIKGDFKELDKIFAKIDEKSLTAINKGKYYSLLGIQYTLLKDPDNAILMYNRSIKFAIQSHDRYGYLHSLYEKARLYETMKKLNMAKPLFFKLKKRAEALGSKLYIGLAEMGIGDYYFRNKQYKKSHSVFKTCLDVISMVGDFRMVAYAMLNESIALMEINQFVDAEADIKNAAEIFRKIGIRDMYIASLNTLADIYVRKKEYDKALKITKRTGRIATKYGFTDELIHISNILKNVTKKSD